MELVTRTACAGLGTAMSEGYSASPVTLSRPSTRGRGRPIDPFRMAGEAISHLQGGGLQQGTHQRALAELHLESVSGPGFGAGKGGTRCFMGASLIDFVPGQDQFGV